MGDDQEELKADSHRIEAEQMVDQEVEEPAQLEVRPAL